MQLGLNTCRRVGAGSLTGVEPVPERLVLEMGVMCALTYPLMVSSSSLCVSLYVWVVCPVEATVAGGDGGLHHPGDPSHVRPHQLHLHYHLHNTYVVSVKWS